MTTITNAEILLYVVQIMASDLITNLVREFQNVTQNFKEITR